ncbi:uncharacterized protein LOC111703403 isoform X2 [Eurytemora carolleeae]|uniref:uncharacterized protein LOC111703403 isoform X2 n=1 Tax=Eurytemora carolleeae TaxID=1294199 RepID=UPI000C77EB3E|nr:uncharacterized protein LOC111703403 isoform X2 [Eurytemora carolleeae]|eukprot:XP_023331104.1 uncharacterized protein LOC111703403 isoform X2 [Eurytemora affinis]
MIIILLLAVAGSRCRAVEEETTIQPPLPFKYAFAASRTPNGTPDRYVEQEGDATGVIRGSYAYLDPNYEWQKVSYVADENGFHVDSANLPQPNPLKHPEDTIAVTKAKTNHARLYQEIALRNSQVPVPIISTPNVESAAVAAKRSEFQEQYAQIVAEHARIAAEHAKLAELAELAELEEVERLEKERTNKQYY